MSFLFSFVYKDLPVSVINVQLIDLASGLIEIHEYIVL